MLGNTGFYFNFESKICVEIFFWEHGIIEIWTFYFENGYKKINSLVDINNTRDLLEYNFTPKDYQSLFYPEESINIFIKKLYELETLVDKYKMIIWKVNLCYNRKRNFWLNVDRLADYCITLCDPVSFADSKPGGGGESGEIR